MPTLIVDSKAHPESRTAGIQEAIDTLPEEGGVVHIPVGSYALRNSIRLRSNVVLRGEGPGTVLLGPAPVVSELAETTKPNADSIKVRDASGFRVGDQVWVRDFLQGGWHSRYMVLTGIEGETLAGEVVYGLATRIYEESERAWAGTFFPAVWAQHVGGVAVESLTIDGGGHEYDRTPDFVCSAIHTRHVTDARVQNVNIRRWPTDGVSLQGGSGMVTGCVVEDCLGSGLHPGSGIQQSLWIGNISRRNGRGLHVCQSVRNCVIANNLVLQNREDGIWGISDPDRYNIVLGNVSAENGRYGIEASKGVGNVIVANLCRGNSQAAPGAFPGIHLEEHTGNAVAANLCLDDKDRPTQIAGVNEVNPAGQNLVEGNLCVPASPRWIGLADGARTHEEHMAWKERRGR